MNPLLITLCTYNERENLELLIPDILAVAPDAHILVIDDNSPDGTGKIADGLAAADDRVRVLHRAGKLGLGTALLAGFRYAMEHDYQRMLNMDADFSHHPRHIPAIRAAAESADVAIGSRYVECGGVVGWNWRRHVMSQSVNWLARLSLRLKTRDNSGSYRNYSVAMLREVDWDRTVARGYAFQEEVLYRLRRVGCSFAESPILFEDRRYGVTKITWKEAVAAVWVMLRLGVENIFRVRVRKANSNRQ